MSFDPDEFQAAVEESAAGMTGDSISEFIYACFMDRSYSGQYSLSVMKIMRFAGLMTVVVLLCVLIPAWLTRGKSNSVSDGAETKESGKQALTNG